MGNGHTHPYAQQAVVTASQQPNMARKGERTHPGRHGQHQKLVYIECIKRRHGTVCRPGELAAAVHATQPRDQDTPLWDVHDWLFGATLPHRASEGCAVAELQRARWPQLLLTHEVQEQTAFQKIDNKAIRKPSQEAKQKAHRRDQPRTHRNKSAPKGRDTQGLMRRHAMRERGGTHMRVAGSAVRQGLLPTWQKSYRQDNHTLGGL